MREFLLGKKAVAQVTQLTPNRLEVVLITKDDLPILSDKSMMLRLKAFLADLR